ncbi:origin recognition complex, subunit 6 [Podospora didyma]|uniref:Origin recognition complex, subunit 6 n=1 Tax=Podospora didyma TaxID=330526 RepID=A0AAE0NTN2_9PEZI|nr:origin recognition complex, subunit 6 [Podospora didyma]
MNRSIEQALVSLLPTNNATLPQDLTQLASSLLAQSRHRASTLKAEEEVARPYACAHIACARLKISLNLPPIDPRPPIPPRIYKRLYNHLDKILPASSSTPGTPGRATPGAVARTPNSRLRNGSQPHQLGSSPSKSRSRTTPAAKDKTLAEFRRGTGSKPGTPSAAKDSDGLPSWIRPTLRFLCAGLGPARIGPVVMSGVESIVAPRGVRTDDEWVNGNMVAMLGALYLYVWRGVMYSDTDLDAAQYAKFRKELAAALARAREEVKLNAKAPPRKKKQANGEEDGDDDDDERWEGWHSVRPKDFDAAALKMNRYGWLKLDWARGIDDLAQAARDGEEEDDNDDDDGTNQEPVQLRRADTMFQERYDYLSERKKKEYAVWKEGIMGRIKELEGDHRSLARPESDEDAMDIDEN